MDRWKSERVGGHGMGVSEQMGERSSGFVGVRWVGGRGMSMGRMYVLSGWGG